MIIISAFVLLVFLYSLISSRLERTIFTAPIVFATAGILLILGLPVLGELEADRKAFLLIAEVGLVLTLFSDATRINLQVLKGNENLPVRLLGIGMLPTILLGAIAAAILFPQLSLWEASILAAIFAHGLSTLPGIGLYARKLSTLHAAAPEHLAVGDTKSLLEE